MKSAFFEIAPKDLKPHKYRPLSKGHVERIKKSFRPELVGTLIVSERDNGDLVVIDGIHRRQACVDLKVEAVHCEVYKFATMEEEAMFFLGLNTTKKPRLVEQFLAKVKAGDPTARAIKKIVEAHGWTVSEDRTNAIGSITALEMLHEDGRLDDALSLIDDWKGEPRASTTILRALAILFRHRPKVDVGRLAERMHTKTAKQWMSAAKESQLALSGYLGRILANLWINEYNKGYKGPHVGKRLQPLPKRT